MRTVTFGMNISLDGYCNHTIFNASKELHDYFTAMMADVDLLFFGRVMYQLMFPYWADIAKINPVQNMKIDLPKDSLLSIKLLFHDH